MTRILIVEDEPSYREILVFRLTRDGYDTLTAQTGEETLEKFAFGDTDLVLLDLMLPKISGMEVCRKIREKSDVPIIMLTAKGAEKDVISGLDTGADDYLSKPYSYHELTARIRALVRRKEKNDASAQSRAGQNDSRAEIKCAHICMKTAGHTVFANGEQVLLTNKEFALLETLMRNKGDVVSRSVLISRVWGDDYVGDTKTLDVHIKRVRKKLEEKLGEQKYIYTVRGVGYRFDEPEQI